MDWKRRTALELRYDGPVPAGASVPSDFHNSRAEQLVNRRQSAWLEVRRQGRLSARARGEFNRTRRRRHYREWQRRRRNLSRALEIWAAYRHWVHERLGHTV